MAEDNSSGERTESPSAKRRADFRKKGQAAQSREVQTATMFSLLLLFWFFFAPVFLGKTGRIHRFELVNLRRIRHHPFITDAAGLLSGGATLTIVLIPLYLLALIMAKIAGTNPTHVAVAIQYETGKIIAFKG